MTALELREKRQESAKAIEQMRRKEDAEGYEWTGEDEEQWKKVNAEYDDLTRQIEKQERLERAESIAKEQEERADAENRDVGREDFDGRQESTSDQPDARRDRHEAFAAWCRAGNRADITPENRAACERLGFNPHSPSIEISLTPTEDVRSLQAVMRDSHPSMAARRANEHLEQRALSAVIPATGATTIPEGFVNALETNLLAFGGMMQVGTIIRTATGNDLPYPTVDDTSNTGEQLGENTSIGSSTDPTFGAMVLRAYKWSSKLVLVPRELLQDSAFNLAVEIGRLLGTRLGRILNTRMTTGTGAGTIQGITIASTSGLTTASATAITPEEIFDLIHSVDPAYRMQNARFMMHDNIILYVRKLRGNVTGEFLWASGLNGGQSDTLAGYPITVNQDMASSVASTNITMEFGALSKYLIREVGTIILRRLSERYADVDQEGFVAFLRADANLLDAGTAPVKHMTQAT